MDHLLTTLCLSLYSFNQYEKKNKKYTHLLNFKKPILEFSSSNGAVKPF